MEKEKAKIRNRFKSLMDQENENLTMPADGLLFHGLCSNRSFFPKALKNIENKMSFEWKEVEKMLLKMCFDIEKIGKTNYDIHFIINTGATGVLRIDASKNITGIHIHLTGSYLLKKKISTKISYLNKKLSKSMETRTRITCRASKEENWENDV